MQNKGRDGFQGGADDEAEEKSFRTVVSKTKATDIYTNTRFYAYAAEKKYNYIA